MVCRLTLVCCDTVERTGCGNACARTPFDMAYQRIIPTNGSFSDRSCTFHPSLIPVTLRPPCAHLACTPYVRPMSAAFARSPGDQHAARSAHQRASDEMSLSRMVFPGGIHQFSSQPLPGGSAGAAQSNPSVPARGAATAAPVRDAPPPAARLPTSTAAVGTATHAGASATSDPKLADIDEMRAALDAALRDSAELLHAHKADAQLWLTLDPMADPSSQPDAYDRYAAASRLSASPQRSYVSTASNSQHQPQHQDQHQHQHQHQPQHQQSPSSQLRPRVPAPVHGSPGARSTRSGTGRSPAGAMSSSELDTSADDAMQEVSGQFADLVAAARERWLQADEAARFLWLGAERAVGVIYDVIGPVAPPVRPASGNLFIVDERRLRAWRQDGYTYGPPTTRASSISSMPVSRSLASELGVVSQWQALLQVTIEWATIEERGVALQRRAYRLSYPGPDGPGGADWIWLVQYLADLSPPALPRDEADAAPRNAIPRGRSIPRSPPAAGDGATAPDAAATRDVPNQAAAVASAAGAEGDQVAGIWEEYDALVGREGGGSDPIDAAPESASPSSYGQRHAVPRGRELPRTPAPVMGSTDGSDVDGGSGSRSGSYSQSYSGSSPRTESDGDDVAPHGNRSGHRDGGGGRGVRSGSDSSSYASNGYGGDSYYDQMYDDGADDVGSYGDDAARADTPLSSLSGRGDDIVGTQAPPGVAVLPSAQVQQQAHLQAQAQAQAQAT